MYKVYKEKYPDCFDVLLWNEAGELTEFTNGNIVVELTGKW
jgi:para-aminobenzoate synthetase / 4-amino-4-deoxychorismate lyase